ncbi:putative peroxiredoxin [Cyclonatronum proteinivorum]|uniref:Putative peroxiredoxin n=1 Tax=Cyclonatronum proteinivorum TaxID=1457365 RepID=A0A345UG48_9BACT|nr:DsrE family protein [Cyclonatronum proteinivorum]AXI99449.1 putative peroxiredoxin [Cyclonatronum proteinivorum]
MKAIILTLFVLASLTAFTHAADHHETKELFVVLTSANAETQMMALVLATQSFNQDVPVRILLCSEAGDLALKDSESPAFKPADRSPKQLLMNLMNNGVTVEVCGIYLPNREHLSADDLLEGVGTARPPEVAAYMKQPHIRYFSF